MSLKENILNAVFFILMVDVVLLMWYILEIAAGMHVYHIAWLDAQARFIIHFFN